MSNRNAAEIAAHRKPKVSLAMIINQGLGGSKRRTSLCSARTLRIYESVFTPLDTKLSNGAGIRTLKEKGIILFVHL